MSANDAHDGGLQDGEPPGVLSLLAIAASMLLCWIFYRVRMRQCEMVLAEMAKALEEVRRSAEALQTRRSIVRATTAFAEKALTEYKTLLNMLDEMQAGDCRKANLPNLRHEIEMETMRAQVNMVQGCLLAMSQEALNLQALSAGEEKQVTSLSGCSVLVQCESKRSDLCPSIAGRHCVIFAPPEKIIHAHVRGASFSVGEKELRKYKIIFIGGTRKIQNSKNDLA
ncbi:uncharacterized protein LOC117644082 isoform X1 [Thrips palmi]|uniref:Uncharacterized protein LOC117644082 isoform X1 n=1 Tax=Thrips palmi TaxID=161013 RepID=A0A6P8YY41_THRPL|nr:uncharacterized protein LOC117644082 isoform X1 [Thrips palmi]